MVNDTVQRLEDNIARAKDVIEVERALHRLLENKDFRKVIKEGYLENEAIRLVHLKADPAFQTPERKESINAQIDAIGYFLQYCRTVSFNAAVAVKSMESDEATRDELLSEELSHG
jgi:hypothetical protein